MIHGKFVLDISGFTFRNMKILQGSNIWNVPLASPKIRIYIQRKGFFIIFSWGCIKFLLTMNYMIRRINASVAIV